MCWGFRQKIYCSLDNVNPDTAYVTNNNRIDILAKPLANGDIALAFIKLSDSRYTDEHSIDVGNIIKYIGDKMIDTYKFGNAAGYHIKNLWSGETTENISGFFSVIGIDAYDNLTIRVAPI
ncbi:MAG: hypothetical protein ACOCRZ_03705 [Halothermotrichaceae bacterium]